MPNRKAGTHSPDMTNEGLFTSNTDEWATPYDFFQKQEARFGEFDLDPCATQWNAKAARYFTKEVDGLAQEWNAERVWMNPPYGNTIGKWLLKAVAEVKLGRAKMVVCLIPARTDTAWWHDIVAPNATHIEFIRGRLKFGGSKNSAPFPSVIVVFTP